MKHCEGMDIANKFKKFKKQKTHVLFEEKINIIIIIIIYYGDSSL